MTRGSSYLLPSFVTGSHLNAEPTGSDLAEWCFTMDLSPLISNVPIWIGIAFCITQSAIFSGLNLAIFSISKLRLEVEAAGGNRDAVELLALRQDSNLTLATVLWGNVTINVLLTLLSDSVLAGIGAFAFSTVVITLFGEIIPQAYFSRNALRMAARLTPLLKVYQVDPFSGSEAYSDSSQLVARTRGNHSSTRARLPSVYYKARGSCGRGRRTIGGNRRAEFSRPRRYPCDRMRGSRSTLAVSSLFPSKMNGLCYRSLNARPMTRSCGD